MGRFVHVLTLFIEGLRDGVMRFKGHHPIRERLVVPDAVNLLGMQALFWLRHRGNRQDWLNPIRVLSLPMSFEKIDMNVGEINAAAGLRILVVEDNTLNQFVIRQILTRWETNLTIAPNGREAVRLLHEHDYDIVLMDLQMPELTGFEATEQIRSKGSTVRNPAIPIIALTADAFAETKRKVMESGMNDFITKPFSQEELYTKIMQLCS